MLNPALNGWPSKPTRRFIGHALEMTAVMLVGMVVLGMAFRQLHILAFGNGFATAWDDHVVLAASAMAFNMTVPMVLWMRYRGHTWERGGEMAVGMNLPLLPALLLYWLDAIPAQGVLGMQMMLMIPGMLAAMLYRKDEYTAPHTAHHHRRWFAAHSG